MSDWIRPWLGTNEAITNCVATISNSGDGWGGASPASLSPVFGQTDEMQYIFKH